MALDESAIRRIMREERENAKREDEREARDKQRDTELAELREKVGKLSAKPNHEAEPEGDDHPFES